MAHPGRTPVEFIDRLVDLGLDGLEVYCSTHMPEDCARFAGYCRSRGLLMTAGSDYHGMSVKPDVRMADLPAGDYGMFEALQRLAHKRG